MSEEPSMSVKAYLDVGGGKFEVRRFGLPEAMATNFTCMKEKISGVFSLSGQPLTLSWKDSENDDIVISSDEELMEAITDSLSGTSTSLFRIFVTVGARPDLGPNNSLPGSESGALHEGVVCDGCEGSIRGFRYSCMQCKDFDLCAACEHKGKHHEHRVMRVPTPGAKGGPKFWWREHGGPPGHFSTSFGVNTENGGNTFSQSSSSTSAGPNAFGGWGAEGPHYRGRRRGCGRGRRGWGGWFGRPWGGAWMGGFGGPNGPNMPGTPQASSQNQQQQQQSSQKEDPQQKQQQQQQQSCGNSSTGQFSGEDCEWNEESCPFMEAQDAAEFSEEAARDAARAAAEAGKMAEEVAAQASQFASQFASQMASEHVANVMKGIWTAWSGQEGAQARATAGSVPEGGETAATNSNTGSNQTRNENNSGSGSQEDAYLRTIGNTVASMLDPLGIDVEVSVDHNGIRQRCADTPAKGSNNQTTATTTAAAATTTNSSTTPSAPVAATATQTPPPTPVAMATQTPIIAFTQTTQTRQANSTPTVTIPSSEESSRSSSQEPEQMEVTAPTNIQEIEMEADHSSDNEWTMVNESPVAAPASAPSPQAMSSDRGQGSQAKSPPIVNYPNLTEFRPPTPRHPNPVIQRAIDQMLAMGYNNEDGWLTQLLEAKHGDINKVLDLLQPAKKSK
ncbi:unnamed protein product [Meganyctiphanes norvegica]|uniref:Sequestosome-1 n=1 Tax=Meganyctiphanes norvegica TaxID=48144 RepID=A0AAV2R1E2_MEGNR